MARRDQGRATGSALAVSLLAHLVILFVLAREVAPGLRTPPPAASDVQLDLVREPPPIPVASARAPARRAAAAVAPATPTPLRVRPTPRLRPTPPLPIPPLRPPRAPATPVPPVPSRPLASAPPVPAGGAGQGDARAAGGGAGQGRWAVQGEDEGDAGVRKVLRATAGCSHEDFAELRPDERAECDRRTGKEARLFVQQMDAMDPGKRAAFAAAAGAQDRARAARNAPVPDVMTPCKGQSNLGVGCVNTPFKHGSGGP